MKTFALALAALFSAAALPASTIAEAIGSRAPTAILRTMPSDTPANQRMAGLAFVAGYQTIGPATPIPADRAAALAAQLKSPTATDDHSNDEHMRPGVAYRFGSDGDAVDVLVCFSCDKIAVIPPNSDVVSEVFHITQPTRDVLLDLAKQLLPQDEAIQELPRVRSTRPVPPPGAPVPADAPRAGGPGAN